MSCSMSWIDPSANPRSKLTRLIQWELTMRATWKESITTKSIAYLWHSNTPQPKPTFLSFIHDWKVHGLNLILRDLQLCQMNYSLSGNSFLKNGESKSVKKETYFNLARNILNDNFWHSVYTIVFVCVSSF